MEKKINEIVAWMQKEVKDANAKGVVIGISGGIDSAVVAALAKKAFPNNVLGLWMGIDSSRSSRRNALRVFQNLEIEKLDLNLKSGLNQFIKDIFELEILDENDVEAFTKKMNGEDLPKDTSYLKLANYQEIVGNIKARLRMVALYAWAQRNNYLVLNTSNLSEIYIGYYTKWGDGVGDLAPIANFTKKEINNLAKIFKLPEMVISSPPVADLWNNQEIDEKILGVTYNEIDDFLQKKPLAKNKKEIIKKLHQQNIHKIQGVKTNK